MAYVHVRSYKDEALNDSDKSWVVPSGETWRILFLETYTETTATAGDRLIILELKDTAGAVAGRVHPEHAVGAGGGYDRSTWAPGLAYANSPGGGAGFNVRFPHNLLVPAGWTLRIYDFNAIDPTADDLKVYFVVEVYTV